MTIYCFRVFKKANYTGGSDLIDAEGFFEDEDDAKAEAQKWNERLNKMCVEFPGRYEKADAENKFFVSDYILTGTIETVEVIKSSKS